MKCFQKEKYIDNMTLNRKVKDKKEKKERKRKKRRKKRSKKGSW
jgi:hypothetical protein